MSHVLVSFPIIIIIMSGESNKRNERYSLAYGSRAQSLLVGTTKQCELEAPDDPALAIRNRE